VHLLRDRLPRRLQPLAPGAPGRVEVHHHCAPPRAPPVSGPARGAQPRRGACERRRARPSGPTRAPHAPGQRLGAARADTSGDAQPRPGVGLAGRGPPTHGVLLQRRLERLFGQAQRDVNIGHVLHGPRPRVVQHAWVAYSQARLRADSPAPGSASHALRSQHAQEPQPGAALLHRQRHAQTREGLHCCMRL